MDLEDPPPNKGRVSSEDDSQSPQSARKLPDDLPTSLDDRRTVQTYAGETEMYDAWQGERPHSTDLPMTLEQQFRQDLA